MKHLWNRYLIEESNLTSLINPKHNCKLDIANVVNLPYFPYYIGNYSNIYNPYIQSDNYYDEYLQGKLCKKNVITNELQNLNINDFISLTTNIDVNKFHEILNKHNIIIYGFSLACFYKNTLFDHFKTAEFRKTNYINLAVKCSSVVKFSENIVDIINMLIETPNDEIDFIIENTNCVEINVPSKFLTDITIKNNVYSQYFTYKMNKLSENQFTENKLFNRIFTELNIVPTINNINIVSTDDISNNDEFILHPDNINEKNSIVIHNTKYFRLPITITMCDNKTTITEFINQLELPIEKIYYNGSSTILFPSCVSTLLTNTLINTNMNTNLDKFTKKIIHINKYDIGAFISKNIKEYINTKFGNYYENAVDDTYYRNDFDILNEYYILDIYNLYSLDKKIDTHKIINEMLSIK